MGCLFGAKLAPFAEIKMLGTWRDGVDAIREHGIHLSSSDGDHFIRVFVTDRLEDIGDTDAAIIARKAWQTVTAAQQVAQILGPQGIALTMQNGLGNLEVLQQHVGEARAALGVTTQGSTLIGPGHLRYAGGGPTSIGVTKQTRACLQEIADLFSHAGFETHLAEDVQGLLWGKLAVNCGINALTALLHVQNGELLTRHDAEELMVRSAQECYDVALGLGIKMPYDDPVEQVRSVAEKTALNYSSMFQDRERLAPTEIEAINGAVVKEGRRIGIPTPTNELLWHLVRAQTN
jgi:2-dehydropantoate 2-reductase